MDSVLTLPSLRQAYRDNQNIMRLIREASGQTTNDPLAILASYDLQAGSYVAALQNAEALKVHERYTAAIARILDRLGPTSLLEAGVGEATTLLSVTRQMVNTMPLYGFDLSWSRIHIACRYWNAGGARPVKLFVAELESIPLPDRSIDVVFTSHAIEPNHGRERSILRELGRIAGRYLVLCEPGYELAGADAKQTMDEHGYCRQLKTIAVDEGWRVLEHRLLETCKNPLNPTAVLVLEKKHAAGGAQRPEYSCPECRRPLTLADGALFCENDGLAYPILRGIPCLAKRNAIIASQFMASAGNPAKASTSSSGV